MADVELIALTIEARRRGVSYGQLVARTTEKERRKIVEKYRGGPQKKGNKGKKQGRADGARPLRHGFVRCPRSPGAAQRAGPSPYI